MIGGYHEQSRNYHAGNNQRHVHVDDTIYKATQSDFQKAMAYCNSGNFDKAYPILQGVIKKCPLHTDAFRVLGQIEMERGSYGKAEDFVLSALTIDPTNLWALVLMGNIYAYQGKIDVADTYYHRVLEYHPDDIWKVRRCLIVEDVPDNGCI